MGTHHLHGSTPDRRTESRSETERYHSVQFTTQNLGSFYQFKLWNISPKGMCILVKEESDVLKHIKIGETIEMTYYLKDVHMGQEQLNTQIKHITKSDDGRFQGHFLVGLSIL